MANNINNLNDRRRNDWIRLIQRLLGQATESQLRDIYMMLCGYLGVKRE